MYEPRTHPSEARATRDESENSPICVSHGNVHHVPRTKSKPATRVHARQALNARSPPVQTERVVSGKGGVNEVNAVGYGGGEGGRSGRCSIEPKANAVGYGGGKEGRPGRCSIEPNVAGAAKSAAEWKNPNAGRPWAGAGIEEGSIGTGPAGEAEGSRSVPPTSEGGRVVFTRRTPAPSAVGTADASGGGDGAWRGGGKAETGNRQGSRRSWRTQRTRRSPRSWRNWPRGQSLRPPPRSAKLYVLMLSRSSSRDLNARIAVI